MAFARAQETWLVDTPAAIETTDPVALAAAGFKRSPVNIFWVCLNTTFGTYCLGWRLPCQRRRLADWETAPRAG